MNIREAKEEIIRTVHAYTAKDESGSYRIPSVRQRPVLLIGPPGIGKTAIMEQAAEECGVGLLSYTITHHTRQSAVGLPQLVTKTFGDREYTMTEYTMSEIVGSVYEYQERTGYQEGILFVDEINCVSETLAPTMLQFLQYKTFGNHRVPAGWIIVAAGNPQEYNRSVRELDMAALDRVRVLNVEADVSVWKDYAQQQGVHPVILSYLELHPEHFYQVTLTRERQEFVTARGWEDLSVLLSEYEREGFLPDRSFMEEFLRVPKIASDFASCYQLCKTYTGMYRIKEFLEDGLTKEENRELQVQLLAAPGEVRCIFIRYMLSAASGKMTEYGRRYRYYEREKEVLTQFSSYMKTEGKGDPEGFLKRRSHALLVRRENDLLKPWEEQMEQEVDEWLKKLLFGTGRETFLKELSEYETEGTGGLLHAELLKERDQLYMQKEKLTDFLNRMTDFVAGTFGEDLELSDWLNGIENHGDYRQTGFQRPEFHAFLDQKKQEEKLRKKVEEMEVLYETDDRR